MKKQDTFQAERGSKGHLKPKEGHETDVSAQMSGLVGSEINEKCLKCKKECKQGKNTVVQYCPNYKQA